MKKFQVFFFTFSVFIFFHFSVFADIPQAEHNALMDIYNSTGGANWYNHTNWGGALGTENTWYGIVLDPTQSNVIEINLPGNNLTGALPASLKNLTKLQKLDLAWNHLTGNIPDLSTLTTLQYLDLSNSNGLSAGTIPSWITSLTQLTHLGLRNCNRNGTIPDLSPLTSLLYLDLSYNSFTSGAIPSSIFSLATLQHLALSGTNRTGAIPADIGNLTNLIILDLSANQLTTIPSQISALANLQEFYLSYNNISTLPAEIGSLPSLQRLYLDSNQLTTLPTQIGNLANLQNLSLSSNKIATLLPELFNLTNLVELHLALNQLTTITTQIGNLTNLRVLNLSSNKISGAIPTQIGNLTNLNYLFLNSNALTGSIPPSLQNLTNLVNGNGLDIRWNGLYTSDNALTVFLNQKQCCSADWRDTQTIAPSNLTAESPTLNSITLSWTPITYQSDSGGYRVYYSTTSGGPYTYKGITSNKSASSMVVDALSSGTTYYFVVKTQTNPHSNNSNTVVSDDSLEVFATTTCPTITLSPSVLPSGTISTLYSQTISASGGTSPYTYILTSGLLPPGLTLNGATGLISGTPTTTGTFNFTITATDSKLCTGSQSYTVLINSAGCPTVTLSPSTLPSGTIGTPYSQTITASGGVSPYIYIITSGSPPPGLTFNGTTGLISGTPITAGTYNFTITATDQNSCSGVVPYSITITCPPITLSPTSLPLGTVGVGYNQTITASGGIPPYTYSLASGALPAGLNVNPVTGVLSGTPTTSGTFVFTLQATDNLGCSGTQEYTLVINASNCPVITLSPTALPDGNVGNPYNVTITANGGVGPYNFVLTSGSLPPGLILTNEGILYGTPTTAGTYTFTIEAIDTQSCCICFGIQYYTLIIHPYCPTITLSPTTLPNGTVGSEYPSTTITPAGGTAPYTFATICPLPPGLTLSSSGVLSGTPTSAGTYKVAIVATDKNGCIGTNEYLIIINPVGCPNITVSPNTLPDGTVGNPYSSIISANGGTQPYTFSLSLGTLPPGLTLTNSGVLSGEPTLQGTYTFTITVTDSKNCAASKQYSIIINYPCEDITLSPDTLPSGTAGISYTSTTIAASGGTAPYTFAVISGTLPTGLALDSSTGIVSGMPTTKGTFNFTVSATDLNKCVGIKSYTVLICGGITFSPASLPSGKAGEFYNQTIVASGGTQPYAFFIIDGYLPVEMTLLPTGVLSGTPSTGGTYHFTVLAIDANGCTGSFSYTLNLSSPPYIYGVEKLTDPFRIKIKGSNFHPDLKVYIQSGSTDILWSNIKFVNTTKIILKSGEILKTFFPKGVPVTIRIVNGDGGSATTTFVR